MERLLIALEHFEDSLRFYGVALGLRVFRKHLGWYLESSAWMSAIARRAARSHLCRLETPQDVMDGLKAYWAGAGFQDGAGTGRATKRGTLSSMLLTKVRFCVCSGRRMLRFSDAVSSSRGPYSVARTSFKLTWHVPSFFGAGPCNTKATLRMLSGGTE